LLRRISSKDTIVQAIMGARYAPPKRRKSAWLEGYNEDLRKPIVSPRRS
jgi:hypothetical protein